MKTVLLIIFTLLQVLVLSSAQAKAATGVVFTIEHDHFNDFDHDDLDDHAEISQAHSDEIEFKTHIFVHRHSPTEPIHSHTHTHLVTADYFIAKNVFLIEPLVFDSIFSSEVIVPTKSPYLDSAFRPPIA